MKTTTLNRVRRGFYLDSVALMRVSAQINALSGVAGAALMIGTESNKEILREAGLLAEAAADAGPNDLILAVRAQSDTVAEQALIVAEAALAAVPGMDGQDREHRPRSLDAALAALPDASLALISIPGEFAEHEARAALRRGLNVMIFSDNLSVAVERSLKQEAQQQSLLVMGPDCGTALLGGVPVAFANAVPRGAIGVVAASGTGLQEFSVLVARAGLGISHGIGVGGRDLSDAVGGISTLAALDLLERDPATEKIVLISKPPGPATAARVLQRAAASQKPLIACFIGGAKLDLPVSVSAAATLEQAARLAAARPLYEESVIALPAVSADGGRRFLRGLFSGGTLCAEAQVVLGGAGLMLSSNAPIAGVSDLNAGINGRHALLDLGADEYTRGRPHPMIEPAVRNELLAQALAEPDLAVILLDIVLGFGAHPDPAGEVAATLTGVPPGPVVVASVCGTEGDPQTYSAQTRKLREAGVVLAPSNARAAELAWRVLERGGGAGS